MTVEEKRMVVRNYCKSTRCGSCELFHSWCANYNKRTCPESALDVALELIGYEQPDKEDNVSENKKPRLAEVLGVEVNEKFDFVGGGFTHCCYVDSNGWLRDQNGNMCDTHAVFLINNPQYMRRRSRWTEQEVEDAKAIRRLMSEYTHIKKERPDRGTYLLLESAGIESYALSPELFPSLKVGETVKITDIIGGNE